MKTEYVVVAEQEGLRLIITEHPHLCIKPVYHAIHNIWA